MLHSAPQTRLYCLVEYLLSLVSSWQYKKYHRAKIKYYLANIKYCSGKQTELLRFWENIYHLERFFD